jgi:5-methylthioadenosine/S-adenosylhomocysteine deaminase
MQTCDTLICPRWVIPVEPAGVALDHHAIAIRDGRIAAILPQQAARAAFTARHVVERPSGVAIPGLVNAHTHAGMSLMRGMADDLALDDWLQSHIWPTEAAHASAGMVRDGTRLAVAEMLRGGTTCFNDMYFFPDIVADTAAAHHIRAAVGMIVLEFPTAWARDADEYLSKGLAVRDQFRGHPLISTVFAPHAPYTVGDEALRRIRVQADQLDAAVVIHLHETRNEIERAVAESGKRPFDRLAELGFVNSSLVAVHMAHLTEDEIRRAGDARVNIAHCPESNLKLASGMAPTAALAAAGANVAIGTDGAASNNDLDMLGEMRTAALLAKAVAGDATAVGASEALTMATLNGARALGLDEETGSLVPGKWADIACVDLRAAHVRPVFDPVSALVYAARADDVSDVWVAGRRVVEERRLTTLDEAAVLARADEWRDRIVASQQTESREYAN